MTAQVTKPAPDFTAEAVVGDEFQTVRLSDFRGKYVVLFFYPLDFTFVCPTEIIAFSDRADEFHRRGCHLLGVSVDSKYTHLAWTKTPRDVYVKTFGEPKKARAEQQAPAMALGSATAVASGPPIDLFTIKEDTCVGCNMCALACPVEGCITMEKIDTGRPPMS